MTERADRFVTWLNADLHLFDMRAAIEDAAKRLAASSRRDSVVYILEVKKVVRLQPPPVSVEDF